MRPNRLKVPHSPGQSFDLRHERVACFTHPWHFHPELELNFVVVSTGTRFIGQRVQRFEGGEIVLLGPNLPHYWKNDAAYAHPESPQPAEAIVVRFAPDFVGSAFFELPEAAALRALWAKSIGGLMLLEPLRTGVAAALHRLLTLDGFEQLMALLTLLQRIATSDAVEVISPNYVPSQLLTRHNERLNRVIAYLMEHFTEPIATGQVADLAGMNPAAFCRYFKAQTGQTLTQFVTDLRIRYACELLGKSDESVAEVGFRVGFDNASHFIQAFKKQQNQTPTGYRKLSNR
ncbi:MAG: AraC family transcriptional regulator [Cytophagaceae bacterium]|nr:AraC family transcriptional regulator [Cytophagaceae bacterium]